MVTEKEIKMLIELAESKIRTGVSRQEAMETLVGAGIFDINGEYTQPYREMLAEAGIEV